MNDLKEKYYLQQNINLTPVHLMEALGYEVRTLLTGGYSYYKNGEAVIVEKFPSEADIKTFVKDLENGLSVDQAKENFLKDWQST